MSNYVSESGHWYNPDGLPFYEIENKSKPGTLRPVTLRDAKKLNLFPSVTTIIKIADAPGLDIWKQKQVLLAALTLPRIEGESDTEFADRVIEDSRHEAETKRQRGTEIHGAIDKYFIDGKYDPEYWPYIEGVLKILPKVEKWDSERSFSHKYGFGGKIDLHSKHDQILIDFKTKEFDESDKIDIYDQQKMQLSAYASGLGFTVPKMYNCFVSTNNPGLCRLVEHAEFQRYYEMFLNLLGYYKLKNNYYPEAQNG